VSDETLEKISDQLEQLIKLTAANTVKGIKQNQAIVLLGSAGLDRNLIAEILGTTPNTVSVRLSQAKSAAKAAPAKKGKTAESTPDAISGEEA
jgi:DNA-directed RNA polymerase specialized sigma24 family protein